MKHILIIGASSGIGAAVAGVLAANLSPNSGEAVWKVILHGRDEERLEALRSIIGHLRSKDQCPASSVQCLYGDVVAWAEDPKSIPAIEPVDAIIWSAGICELAAGQMLGLKALRRTLAVNLEAPLVVISHFYRKGIIKDGGTIVLLGSESAHDAGEGFSVYAASKGGLAAAARVLGKEFARRDVSVHCLEPGTVNTPMTQKLVAAFGGLKGGHMEKMVEPEDVAAEIVGILENNSSCSAKALQDKREDAKAQS